MKTILLATAMGCVALVGRLAEAATINWTNTASGNWGNAANWNPNSVPGPTDTAIITNAGVTVTLDISPTVGAVILGTNGAVPVTLSLNGQTLSLNGPLTVNPSGSFTVDSGSLTGNINAVLSGTLNWSATSGARLAGVLTLATNGTINITSGSDHDMPSCTFTNNGTVVWLGGRIRGGSTPGTIIQNNGLWSVQTDYSFQNDFGGAGTFFNNGGTFRKSVTTGDTTLVPGVYYTQTSGSSDVQSGRVVLQGSGSFTGGKATNTVGTLVLNAGSFLINGTVMSTNVQLNGGTLARGSSVINGGFNWVTGTWDSGGPLTVAANSLLLITSTSDHDLYNCVFTNLGTVAWSNGRIRGGADPSGTQIYNYGVFDVQNDGYGINNDGGGGEGTFINNFGTFRKSVGTNTSNTPIYGGVVFNQLAGVLDTQNGVLSLASGGNFTGGFTTTNSSGTTWLYGGGFTINGAVTSSNVVQNGGNLAGTNVIRGALQWQAGLWDNAGAVTLAASSTLFINGTTDHDLYNCVFTNLGSVIWTAGRIRGGADPYGTTIANYGLFDVQNDSYTINNDGGGSEGTFINNIGTFRKSVGTNTSNTTIYGGVVFNQLAGVLDTQNGVLSLASGGNFTGGRATNTMGVLVFSAGSYLLSGTTTSTNVQFNGGTLADGNNVVNGGLNWIGGSWNNGGQMTVASGSQLLVTSGNDHDMANLAFTNNGSIIWSNGRIRGGGGAGTTFANNGLFDVQCDFAINNDFGGIGTIFVNTGTFRKELTTGTTMLTGGVLYDHTGILDVQSGSVVLQGSGNFTGGTVNNLAGTIVLNSGSFFINGTATSTNMQLNGGTLATGNNVINGGLNWIVGDWSNGGPLTLATGGLLLLTSVNDHNMANCIFTNNGTVLWSNGRIRGGGNPGTPIYNNGLFDVQCDFSVNNDFGGLGTTFNNAGIFRKELTTGATTLTGGVVYNNTGTLDVQTGTTYLSGGGSFTGGTATNTGPIILNGGSFYINGTVTTTNLQLNGSIPALANNVIRGGANWVAGDWNNVGPVTLAPGATLLVTSGNDHNMANCIFTNNGSVYWSGGSFRCGGNPGTQIYNAGLFDAQVDQVLNNDFGGVGTTIYNTGIFRKELTTGSTTLTSGIMVDNSGTLDVQSGNLSLQGGYSLTNGTLNVGINSLTNNGTISLTGAAPLVGTVSANLNNGYQPVSGNSFTNIYYGSYTGGFSNSVLPFLDAWSTNYFPTCFVLNVLNARPIFVAPNTNRFVVNELTTLNVPNTAMDADLPPQALVYGLVAGTNGVAVNSSTGLLTWTPQQTNSPTTNVFSVAVTDNGTPALSATNTYTVIVREVNVPPSLSAVPTKTVNELTLLTVNDTATNANIHSTNSGYALVNPPSGMVISASGVITWTPAQTQSPSTNTITTIVTNSNPYAVANPHLTATNTFTVVVKEVNQAPTLPLVGTQTVTLLQLFTLNNSATEPNIHSTNFGYALISPPTGAAISSGGIITWTPAPNQTLTTNTLTTVVTNGNPYDAVNPRLTVTNSFKAVVRPSLVRTNVTLTASGSSLNLAWPADHTGWELQAQTNTLAVGIGSNWAIVSGSQDTNQMTLPIVSTNPAVFFRIAYP